MLQDRHTFRSSNSSQRGESKKVLQGLRDLVSFFNFWLGFADSESS